jgi:hypothetical protein
MKLTSIVDDFVTQVVQFVGKVLSTAFLFWRSPESLFAMVAGSATNAESLVSPITFLAASEFAFLLTLIAGHATAKDNVRELFSRATFGPEALLKAMTEGDWKKLGLLAVPFFGVVAGHAGLVDVAAAILGHSLDYRVSLGAGCYMVGFYFLVCAVGTLVMLPWFGLIFRSRISWFAVASAIPFWIVTLRGFYAYLLLLSHFLGGSALKSFGVWALGTFLFLLVGALLALWASPLLDRSTSRGRRDISPKADVRDPDHPQHDHYELGSRS